MARPRFIRRTISKQRLAALNEVHTPSGKHKLLVTPFPDWVPTEVLQAAQKVTEKEAASQLAVVLSLSSMPPNKCAPANRRYGFSARCGLYRSRGFSGGGKCK